MKIPVFQAIIGTTTLIRGIVTGYTTYGSKTYLQDHHYTTADQGDTSDPATNSVSTSEIMFQIIFLYPSFHDVPLYSSSLLG